MDARFFAEWGERSFVGWVARIFAGLPARSVVEGFARDGEVLCFLLFCICLCKSRKLLFGMGGWVGFSRVDPRVSGAETRSRVGVWGWVWSSAAVSGRVAVAGRVAEEVRVAALCDIFE